MILGLDEVGRGSWAGPLTAAAVVLDCKIYNLNDSKLLNQEQREVLASKIIRKAKDVGIGWVSSADIDLIGLTAANGLAMERAIAQITQSYTRIIIDGKYNFLSSSKDSTAIIKADQKYKEVSAASIIAKVARDRYMKMMHEIYPKYGFAHHKGYGTKKHADSLLTFGPTKIHRYTFSPIKSLL